ncbi:hypothetical protein [Propionibacterium sp.]|uniref:hypothetical protein n=1 Tax=Propionibacterium sp. TaxID=1977903 RepID=UPI0039EB3432
MDDYHFIFSRYLETAKAIWQINESGAFKKSPGMLSDDIPLYLCLSELLCNQRLDKAFYLTQGIIETIVCIYSGYSKWFELLQNQTTGLTPLKHTRAEININTARTPPEDDQHPLSSPA